MNMSIDKKGQKIDKFMLMSRGQNWVCSISKIWFYKLQIVHISENIGKTKLIFLPQL